MRRLLSKRDMRALVYGAGTIGMMIGLARGVPAWKGWDSSVRRESARTLHMVALVEAGATQLPHMHDSVRARRTRLDSLATRLFESNTVQEATAALAVHVSEYAAAAEVKVITLQLRADSAFAPDGFARIAVRLNGTSDVAGLAGLLASVEGDTILLAVRELTVSQPEPAAPDTKAEALRFELLVEGLALHSKVRAP